MKKIKAYTVVWNAGKNFGNLRFLYLDNTMSKWSKPISAVEIQPMLFVLKNEAPLWWDEKREILASKWEGIGEGELQKII